MAMSLMSTKPPGERPARAERRARLLGAVAEAVVHAPAVLVGEDLVGEVDLLEPLVRAGVVLVAVGVALRSQLLECALDFLGGRVAADAEDVVVVPLGHRRLCEGPVAHRG